jgi:hypothetical protein
MNKLEHILPSIINIIILYIIYFYINKISTKCQCTKLDANMTKYFNIYVYIMIPFNILKIAYILTNNFIQAYASPFMFIIYAFEIVTYILLLKYIHTLQYSCQCNTIQPNIRKFLYIFSWAIVIINAIWLLFAGIYNYRRVSLGVALYKAKHSKSIIILDNTTLSNELSKPSTKSKIKKLKFKRKM